MNTEREKKRQENDVMCLREELCEERKVKDNLEAQKNKMEKEVTNMRYRLDAVRQELVGQKDKVLWCES